MDYSTQNKEKIKLIFDEECQELGSDLRDILEQTFAAGVNWGVRDFCENTMPAILPFLFEAKDSIDRLDGEVRAILKDV